MKKLLLSFALAFATLIANGQSLSQLWYHSTSSGGLVNSAQVNSGLAINPTNGNIYVAERGGEIYIVNPNDYSSGALNPTAFDLLTKKLPRPIAGANGMTETGRFYKIKVTSKGVIYSVAMQTNGWIYIYKWLNETDASPKKYLIQDPTIVNRVGDSFAIFEDNKGDADADNDEVFIYTSGAAIGAPTNSTGQYLYVIKDDVKIDGTSSGPSFFKTIDMAAAKQSTIFDIAKGAISVESANVIWVKSFQPGVTFRRLVLDFASGTVTQFKSYSAPSSNYTFGEFLRDGSTGYLLAGSSTTNTVPNGVLGLKISLSRAVGAFGSEPTSLAEISAPVMQGTYVASSGYGDFAIKKNVDGTTTVYFLVSKNGLAAYQSDVPLPVSLTAFNASLVKGQSTLTWETASETNNKGFEVMRSTDGKEFTKIDFVNAKGQNGNSSTALSYSYVDRTAKAGTNYYQLNQVDLDGKTELFKDVKSVNVSLAGGVTVFPNPATTYVSVNAGSADFKGVKYELFDANGKKLLSEKAKAEQQDISLSKLPASIYYLKISKNNVVQSTVKLIKQ